MHRIDWQKHLWRIDNEREGKDDMAEVVRDRIQWLGEFKPLYKMDVMLFHDEKGTGKGLWWEEIVGENRDWVLDMVDGDNVIWSV